MPVDVHLDGFLNFEQWYAVKSFVKCAKVIWNALALNHFKQVQRTSWSSDNRILRKFLGNLNNRIIALKLIFENASLSIACDAISSQPHPNQAKFEVCWYLQKVIRSTNEMFGVVAKFIA